MSILTAMKKDRMTAMKSGDKETKQVLTVFIGDMESDMKRGSDVDDSYIIPKVKKAITNAQENHRLSGNEDFLKEVTVLEQYLPQMATPDDVRNFVSNLLQDDEADKSMGAIMKALKIRYGDTLNGKEASGIVREML
jgi:uncharacterized protein YqeY